MMAGVVSFRGETRRGIQGDSQWPGSGMKVSVFSLPSAATSASTRARELTPATKVL